MTVLGWTTLAFGAALLALAAFGVLVLPDALTRQHAATKAATLGLGVMIAGLALLHPAWLLKLVLLALILMVTLPVASHALARAAAHAENARPAALKKPGDEC